MFIVSEGWFFSFVFCVRDLGRFIKKLGQQSRKAELHPTFLHMRQRTEPGEGLQERMANRKHRESAFLDRDKVNHDDFRRIVEAGDETLVSKPCR